MTYSRKQLQHITHHIATQLAYDNEKKLNSNDKKWLERELMAALDPLQRRNTKAIIIAKNNGSLKAFFDLLEEAKISFPEDTVYVVKRDGRSFECSHGEKNEIYNLHKMKSKGNNKKEVSLSEQLKNLSISLSSSEEDFSSEEDLSYTSYTPMSKISSQSPEANIQPISISTTNTQHRYKLI